MKVKGLTCVWHMQAPRDLYEEQPAGKKPSDPCLGEGSCRLRVGQMDQTRSTRQYYKALLREERNGVVHMEEEPQVSTSRVTSHEARIWARAQDQGSGRSRDGEGGRSAALRPVGERLHCAESCYRRLNLPPEETGLTPDLSNKMASLSTQRNQSRTAAVSSLGLAGA